MKTIKITKMEYGRNAGIFCDKVLKLRFAKNIGDTEKVNNYVLGVLRRNVSEKFDFVEL